jgi:O-antigen/teichoic acid export membrane protein
VGDAQEARLTDAALDGGIAPGSAMTKAPASGRPFARRVTVVFAAKIVMFALGLATTVFVARLLGRDGKGVYVAVMSVPGLLGAIGVFGLPTAINYYAARGASVRGLFRTGIVLALGLSVVMIGLVWLALPILEQSILRGARDFDFLLRVILLAIPSVMLTVFTGTILYGLQEVRLYSAIGIGQAVGTLLLLVFFVGVLRLGVKGAVLASLTISWLYAAVVLTAVWRVGRRRPGNEPVSTRKLIRYGGRAYPASLTGFFNYRADTFIIQALAAAPAAALGLYSMAVTMAEMIFFIPDSVTMILLPRVAGSTDEEAAEFLGRVSRMTVLICGSCAIALIPIAWLGINLVLPAFRDCLPAFLVLLPGIVSLCVAKIMTSYIGGRGRPGAISVGATIALVFNLAANLVLIPTLGIVGAALASLLSYTILAALMLAVACRLSRHSPLDLVLPRMEDARAVWALAIHARSGLLRRWRGPAAPADAERDDPEIR